MDSQPNRGSCRATVHAAHADREAQGREAPARSCASETKKQRKQRALPAMTIERDQHWGSADAARQKAEVAQGWGELRCSMPRVPVVLTAGQWTWVSTKYSKTYTGHGELGGGRAAAGGCGCCQFATCCTSALPQRSLDQLCALHEVDLEARCIIERIPRSAPQRICLWRE